MRLIGIYNAPAMVTLAGMACAVGACWLALMGKAEFAVVALIWAGIFDLFDGLVARRRQRSAVESAFGVQIDSLVDVLSFGITPVMIAYALGAQGPLALVVSLLYCTAVIQRLAYFNVQQEEAQQSGSTGLRVYTGLPVTFAALIFSIGFSVYAFLPQAVFSIVASVLMLIVALLYVLPFKLPKPGGVVYVLMPLLALVFSGLWLWLGLMEIR
ncbi:MAG: CDP-diacylglycerol--serine O-phosphatidyltransferase [Alteromonadaceae bacterium]|nr:MAG: CDP-diacylglycerol--serine O-phosphatidyltransferase [Alteromonadaceae bacterium]